MANAFFGVNYCWVLDILLHSISGFVKRVQCWFGSFNWHRQAYSSTLFLQVKQFYPRHPVKRRTGQSKPRWVLRFVLERFAEGKSYRQIVHAFNRLYAHRGMTISLGTVYNWIQKHCSEMEAVRKETRNRFPEPGPANLRWCIDGTGKVTEDGISHFILGIVDHGTRMNFLLQRLELATSSTILEHIKKTMQLFGQPQIIRTDNASVFRSKKFRRALKELGIRQEFSEPGKPWQNGRIERLFLTLKEKLNLITPVNSLALDCLLSDFTARYNLIRPHQHLHGYTPAEV